MAINEINAGMGAVESEGAVAPGALGGTLGAICRAAREARGIAIEQAAHETRIRGERLREIEADDFSRMSPSYARLFTTHYADYLGVPRALLDACLPEADSFGVDGYDYIANAGRAGGGARPARRSSPPRVRRRRFLAILALLVTLGLGIKGYFMWRKIERIRGPADREAQHESARPREGSPLPNSAAGHPQASAARLSVATASQ